MRTAGSASMSALHTDPGWICRSWQKESWRTISTGQRKPAAWWQNLVRFRSAAISSAHSFWMTISPRNVSRDRRIGLEMLKDADELWCFSEYISEGMMAEIQEASRLGLPVRMFCETTGLLGKVLKRVVSDLYPDADGQDWQ